MSNILRTAHPAEVKEALEQYAELLEIYASDQIGSVRWQKSKREKQDCEVRADVYKSIAEELRTTVVVQG